MEIIYRGRGVVQYCPKQEFFEKVVQEIRMKEELIQLGKDPFFESTLVELSDKFQHVWDRRYLHRYTYRFRYNVDGKRHYKGDVYVIRPLKNGTTHFQKEARIINSEFFSFEVEKLLPGVHKLTALNVMDAVDEILVEETLYQ
jgi:hypothetical protein